MVTRECVWHHQQVASTVIVQHRLSHDDFLFFLLQVLVAPLPPLCLANNPTVGVCLDRYHLLIVQCDVCYCLKIQYIIYSGYII